MGYVKYTIVKLEQARRNDSIAAEIETLERAYSNAMTLLDHTAKQQIALQLRLDAGIKILEGWKRGDDWEIHEQALLDALNGVAEKPEPDHPENCACDLCIGRLGE